MNKIFLLKDKNDGLKLFAIDEKTNKKMALNIGTNKIIKYIDDLSSTGVIMVKSTFSSISVFLNNNTVITFDHSILELKKRKEKEQLKKYFDKYHIIPKVNREKSSKIGKRICASVLAGVISLSSISFFNDKEYAYQEDKAPMDTEYISEEDIVVIDSIKDETDVVKDNIDKVDYTYSNEDTSNEDTFDEDISYTSELSIALEDNTIRLDCSFGDLTDTGQLETTQKECGIYIDEFIDRYNLPKDITYGMFALECGKFDCTITSSAGAIGPAQILPSAQDGEKYRVPVYQDNVFTGSYDSFTAATKKSIAMGKYKGEKTVRIDDPKENIQLGCALFRRCIDYYEGNLFMALFSYNYGMYKISNYFENNKTINTLKYYMENPNDLGWLKEMKKEPSYILGVLNYVITDDIGQVKVEVVRHIKSDDTDLTLNYLISNTNKEVLDRKAEGNIGRKV